MAGAEALAGAEVDAADSAVDDAAGAEARCSVMEGAQAQAYVAVALGSG